MTWTFWQYSGEELIDGVYDQLGRLTECDVDYFNGTEEEFDEMFNIHKGEPKPMTDYMKLEPNVAGEYRSIRQQTAYPQTPHILGAKIGQINANSSAKALPTDSYLYVGDIVINGVTQAKAGDIWWKVYEANGLDIAGWVAEIHLGKKYLNTTLVTVEPQPVTHTVEVWIDGVLEYKKELL